MHAAAVPARRPEIGGSMDPGGNPLRFVDYQPQRHGEWSRRVGSLLRPTAAAHAGPNDGGGLSDDPGGEYGHGDWRPAWYRASASGAAVEAAAAAATDATAARLRLVQRKLDAVAAGSAFGAVDGSFSGSPGGGAAPLRTEDLQSLLGDVERLLGGEDDRNDASGHHDQYRDDSGHPELMSQPQQQQYHQPHSGGHGFGASPDLHASAPAHRREQTPPRASQTPPRRRVVPSADASVGGTSPLRQPSQHQHQHNQYQQQQQVQPQPQPPARSHAAVGDEPATDPAIANVYRWFCWVWYNHYWSFGRGQQGGQQGGQQSDGNNYGGRPFNDADAVGGGVQRSDVARSPARRVVVRATSVVAPEGRAGRGRDAGATDAAAAWEDFPPVVPRGPPTGPSAIRRWDAVPAQRQLHSTPHTPPAARAALPRGTHGTPRREGSVRSRNAAALAAETAAPRWRG